MSITSGRILSTWLAGIVAIHWLVLVQFLPAVVGNYTFACPPPLAYAACPGSHLTWVPKALDEAYGSLVVALMLGRSADRRADVRHGIYVSLLSLMEGFHILECVAAYGPPCVPEKDFLHSIGELCGYIRRDLSDLVEQGISRAHIVGHELESSHICWGTGGEDSRLATGAFLQSMLTEVSKDIDNKRAVRWQTEKTPFSLALPRSPPSTPWLLYPSAYAPPNACSLESFSDAPDRFIPEDEAYRPWRDVSGQFARYLSVDAALRRLQRRGIPLSRFVVNLGAANGECGWGSLYDPANCLLADRAANVTAILFEGSSGLFHGLLKKYGRKRHVHLRLGYTRPSFAVRDVLAVMPKDGIDLLKVDVDNCDSCFVDALVQANTRPKLIHVEITSGLPPGLEARVHFSMKDTFKLCGSLGEFLRVAPGYRLLHVENTNAVLVRGDLFGHVAGPTKLNDEEKWRLGWFCHPMRTHSDWSEHLHYRRVGFDLSILADRSVSLQERRSIALSHNEEDARRQRFVIQVRD